MTPQEARLRAERDRLREALEVAAWALQPFADAHRQNESGEYKRATVAVTTAPHSPADPWKAARHAEEVARAALSEQEGGEQGATESPPVGEGERPGHPEDFCDRCGGPNVPWSVPSKLFNEVNGGPNGILCPQCFDRLAYEKGLALLWTVTPDSPFHNPQENPQ